MYKDKTSKLEIKVSISNGSRSNYAINELHLCTNFNWVKY